MSAHASHLSKRRVPAGFWYFCRGCSHVVQSFWSQAETRLVDAGGDWPRAHIVAGLFMHVDSSSPNCPGE